MTKRASPGVGRATIGDNSGLPAHADVRTAVAIEMIFEEKEKKLREEKKLARKRIESMKINKDDTTLLKGLRDKSGNEIEEIFKRQWHLVGAIHQEKYEQLDIFQPKPSAPEKRAAHYALGLLQGLQGKNLECPPMVVGDDRQQMISGHNEGRERHDAAQALILGQALENAANGMVTDGKTGAAINEKAATDFAKDSGEDPLVVKGERYANMRQANAARKRLEQQAAEAAAAQEQPEAPSEGGPLVGDGSGETLPPVSEPAIEQTAPPKRAVMRPVWDDWGDDWTSWTTAQTMEFRRWYESLPSDTVPPITHDGAVGFFRALREEDANRASGGEDEAAEESGPDLSDEAIAAGAKALADSGFTPSKPARRPRA